MHSLRTYSVAWHMERKFSNIYIHTKTHTQLKDPRACGVYLDTLNIALPPKIRVARGPGCPTCLPEQYDGCMGFVFDL